MELQFQNTPLDCLRRVVWEVKNEEQTQEIRLSDAMPDVGKVLAAWGQVLMRSKEWRGSGMGVSGGVMAWVLYAPEDGTEPRSVETWIPFQIRWDFPQTQRDGAMILHCQLRGIDARSVSARKLMVRSCVSVAGEALEPVRMELYAPAQVPEDICLLRKSYPVRLPTEAGEKTFTMEETLQLPSEYPAPVRLMYYNFQTELIDKKVMADKVVFRGSGLLHGLCRCGDGSLKTFDFEVPFSQYSDLEREYDGYAGVQVTPALTNLDLDIQEDGQLSMKAAMVGQYVVYSRPVLEIVEDAYSPNREVRLQIQKMELPVVLDTARQTLTAEQNVDVQAGEILDTVFRVEHPLQRRGEDVLQLQIPGSFQVLYYDEEGNLQSTAVSWEGNWDLPADYDTKVQSVCTLNGKPQTSAGSSIHLRSDMAVETISTADAGIAAVSALEIGELLPPSAQRPSLILRRSGEDSLWNVAKQCGSTIDAILQANGLTEEPQPDQMLLIPVP